MRFLPSATIFLAFIACAATAHADTIQVFNFAGVTFVKSAATGTGSVTVDTTTGKATAIDFTLQQSGHTYDFTTIGNQRGYANQYVISADVTSGNANGQFELVLPESSLVGYAGGTVCAEVHQCQTQSAVNLLLTDFSIVDDTFDSGRLTPGAITTTPVAVTPEPSSVLLLATGAFGIAGVLRRRTSA